ncbi:MAG TPA: sigma-70 family RNA polymerase sigma factor [Ktedonobacteraceae bacterium]|nr:sigma-70 family RNA polymerase sigma factor [Ktedonobacteraceae bacterium]
MQTLEDGNTADELSDEALLSAIAGGAVWAMDSLYQRYSRILYSLAYRMVADHQIAEDLLQDAFLSVWRRSTSFSPQAGAARSWLISILHHRAIDYLRHVRRRSNIQESPLDELELDESTAFPDVWDEAWRSIQSSQVRAALMKVPTEQRMVIELAYFQGWTHTEIAEGTQTPLGTVKARMRLGLNHLKRALEEQGIDEI